MPYVFQTKIDILCCRVCKYAEIRFYGDQFIIGRRNVGFFINSYFVCNTDELASIASGVYITFTQQDTLRFFPENDPLFETCGVLKRIDNVFIPYLDSRK